MESICYCSEVTGNDRDSTRFFYINSIRDAKQFQIDRRDIMLFKQELLYGKSNALKKDYCINLNLAGQHMVVLDIDCQDRDKLTAAKLDDYIENKLAHALNRIVCFNRCKKDSHSIAVVLKNSATKSLHVYMPEYFINSDDYDPFIASMDSSLTTKYFKLDRPLFFMLPYNNKSSKYKLHKIILMDGMTSQTFDSFNDAECVKFLTKNTKKNKDFCLSMIAGFRSLSELYFPVYTSDIRYTTFKIIYETLIQATQRDEEEERPADNEMDVFARLFCRNYSYKTFFKGKKWEVIKNDCKNETFEYVFKIKHLLNDNNNTDSVAMNAWIREIFQNMKISHFSENQGSPVKTLIHNFEVELSMLSPKLATVDDLSFMIVGDKRYNMVFFYVLIAELFKINAYGEESIDEMIEYFKEKLTEREMEGLWRLKQFDPIVLQRAYENFSVKSLHAIALNLLYGRNVKKKNSNFVDHKVRGNCSFIKKQAYRDFSYLLKEGIEGKDSRYLILYLLTERYPIVKNENGSYIWNSFTWVKFVQSDLMAIISVIDQDIHEVCSDVKSKTTEIQQDVKNHICFVLLQMQPISEMDDNNWFLQGNDNYTIDMLTMTNSVTVPEHFCIFKSKLDFEHIFDARPEVNFNGEDFRREYETFGKLPIPEPGLRAAWEYLSTTFDFDEEKINLLIWKLAYFLIGTNPQKFVMWLIGENDNGKTSLLNLMDYMYGDYKGLLDNLTLLDTSKSHRTDVYTGIRKKVLTSDDMKGNIDDAFFKQISGYGKMTYRSLYKNVQEGHIKFKLMISVNSTPECKEPSKALFARFLVLPFDSTFKSIYKNESPEWQVKNRKYPPKTDTELLMGAESIFRMALKRLKDNMNSNGHIKMIELSEAQLRLREEFTKKMTLLWKFGIFFNLQDDVENEFLLLSQVKTKINAFVTKHGLINKAEELLHEFQTEYKDREFELDTADPQEAEAEEDNELVNQFLSKRKKRKITEICYKNLAFGVEQKNYVVG